MEYMVIHAHAVVVLQRNVKEALQLGWAPLGGVAFSERGFAQALTRSVAEGSSACGKDDKSAILEANVHKQLNAPAITADAPELLDVLWHLSEWAMAQCKSPAVAGDQHSHVRERLARIAGELQAIQADVARSR